jgi:hypothetical protein
MRDPLAAFDGTVVETVARQHDIDEQRLRALVRRHQQSVRDLPGVDDIVYEWRRMFPTDPLVERRRDRYVLAPPAHVWAEFGDSLGLDDDEQAAVVAVHTRQANNAVDGDAGEDCVVLTRP